MNREQKAAAIDEVARQVQDAGAVIAVDYRGISVPQLAELRARLREADASFRVVKNTLTLRALDQAGLTELKQYVDGPVAFTFVRGEVAAAAKALHDFARANKIIEFRGGVMEGQAIDAEVLQAIARLPARPQLEAQLAGVIASPITGLVRGLGSLLSGLAIALGQVAEQRGGEEPAAPAEAHAEAEAPAEAESEPAEDAGAEETSEEPKED